MQITLHGDYTEQGPNNLSIVHSFEGLYLPESGFLGSKPLASDSPAVQVYGTPVFV